MDMRISERLQLVFDNLIHEMDVWDICCDHGYLGGAAYKSQKFSNIFFVDQVSSIIEKVKDTFNTYVYCETNTSNAHFIIQSGQSINRPVSGNVCITGVGAYVINDILCGLAQNKSLQASRLILGPHRDTEKLLSMIESNTVFKHYLLNSKKEILENGRSRIFLIFDRK